MKVLFVCAVVLALVASGASAVGGFNSPTEVASVLANEPASASSPRFVECGETNGCGQQAPTEVITFKEGGSSSSGGSSEEEEAAAEFDAQIEQVEADEKKLKEAIKESQEAAQRLNEQQAELRSLEEQKQHLEREKEKRILETKLQRQMKDLNSITSMSRNLRSKFEELKRTQKIIKTKLLGTKSSLNQLDSDVESTGDYQDVADNIGSEMEAMQAAQAQILASSHERNIGHVKSSIESANKAHKEAINEQDF